MVNDNESRTPIITDKMDVSPLGYITTRRQVRRVIEKVPVVNYRSLIGVTHINVVFLVDVKHRG